MEQKYITLSYKVRTLIVRMINSRNMHKAGKNKRTSNAVLDGKLRDGINSYTQAQM